MIREFGSGGAVGHGWWAWQSRYAGRDGRSAVAAQYVSHGPAMAYISHGPADTESLSEFMGSRRRPTSEILAIFMGQPTSAESEKDVRHLFN